MSEPVIVNQLWRHQRQLIQAPYLYPDLSYFFLIGGYGCGKTTADVDFIISLAKRYAKTPTTIGVGGTTITLLKSTLISALVIWLIQAGIPYSFDKQANTLRIGQLTLQLIATEQPELIFAHNFSAFICDELDELPQDKALAAFKAIQERTRKTFPDGRKPFTVFSTTAQGYRGTYSIVEELKEKKQGYVLIRGKTIDNKALDPDYYKRLYSVYDENERLAFLEGKFVNLHTGRVYCDYNPDTDYVEPLDVRPTDEVLVGQDLNTGFSKGVVVVKRDGILYIVKTHSFTDIGMAPGILRSDFPTNTIKWYPDASSKAVLSGYVAEIRNHDIELRMGNVNPDVVDRIFFVNKMFKLGVLKVCKGCKDLDLALKTRQYDDKGKPEKGAGERAPDHISDAMEYVLYRIVSSDQTYRALWQLSRSSRTVKEVTI